MHFVRSSAGGAVCWPSAKRAPQVALARLGGRPAGGDKKRETIHSHVAGENSVGAPAHLALPCLCFPPTPPPLAQEAMGTSLQRTLLQSSGFTCPAKGVYKTGDCSQ